MQDCRCSVQFKTEEHSDSSRGCKTARPNTAVIGLLPSSEVVVVVVGWSNLSSVIRSRHATARL